MYKYDKMYCSNAKYLFSHLFSEPENIRLELWSSQNISSVSIYQLITLCLFLNPHDKKMKLYYNKQTLQPCERMLASPDQEGLTILAVQVIPPWEFTAISNKKSISHMYTCVHMWNTCVSSYQLFFKNTASSQKKLVKKLLQTLPI